MAPANVRSPWSAPACRRCRRALLRPETSHPTPAFHKRPDGLLTRRHCLFEGPAPPRPDGYDSMKGPVPPRPTDATKGVLPSDAVERVPPRPDGVGVIPSFGGLAVSSRVVGRAVLVEGRIPPRPVSRSSSDAPNSMRCRDSPRRLRLREAFGVRQLAGAFEERHRARKPTAPHLSSRPVPRPTLFVGQPTTSTLRGPAFRQARGWVYSNRRPRPESRALCWSEPRERCGIARLCGASSPGRSKSEMRRAARGLRALSLRRGSPGENPWFQERKIRHTPAHATFLR